MQIRSDIVVAALLSTGAIAAAQGNGDLIVDCQLYYTGH